MDAQQFAQQLQQRKEKNLAFFKRYFPSIYEKFHGLKLKNSQLNIDSNTLEVNILEQGQALYPLDANAFNQKEALTFSDAFKPGSFNHPISRSTPDAFYRGRFFHGSLANFLEAVQPVAEAIKPYTFAHSIPQLVFLGSGLGLHIQELLKLRDVRHAVLVEHNPDRFLASLYATDWEEIILPYIQEQTRSFTLSVGDTTGLNEAERIHQGFGGAWNAICENVPFMPVQTVFYVHKADPFYTKVAERLNNEIEAYINVWGYYDDEVNQLNHVIHNIEQEIAVFEPVDLSSHSKATIVCGNGPSLDAHLNIIKKYRHKLNVIAAGSATHSLLKNDIYPDFMVTLESDYATYQALSILPKDKAKQIPIIGAAQIAPETFGLFSDGLMFLKAETAYASLFNDKHSTLENTPPSATNAALSVVLSLNPKYVFLVGMDFGFLDPSNTHSQSAFYTDDEHKERFESFKKRLSSEAYKVQTNQRGDIYSTPFYNTSRSHLERLIRTRQRTDIINLTQGAVIEGTTEKSPLEFESFIESLLTKNNEESIFITLKSKSRPIAKKELNEKVIMMKNSLTDLKEEINNNLKSINPNISSIEDNLFKINQIIINNKNRNISKMEMFMRGAIWHWITNYYALCKEYDSERKLELFTNEFKHYFGGFINYLPEHFSSYIADKSFNDPKLKLSVADAEPNIEEWFKKVQGYHQLK